LQEELRNVRAERDAQILSLNTEKEALILKREQLEKDLVSIKQRVQDINLSVTQLQQEKDQKKRTTMTINSAHETDHKGPQHKKKTTN